MTVCLFPPPPSLELRPLSNFLLPSFPPPSLQLSGWDIVCYRDLRLLCIYECHSVIVHLPIVL